VRTPKADQDVISCRCLTGGSIGLSLVSLPRSVCSNLRCYRSRPSLEVSKQRSNSHSEGALRYVTCPKMAPTGYGLRSLYTSSMARGTSNSHRLRMVSDRAGAFLDHSTKRTSHGNQSPIEAGRNAKNIQQPGIRQWSPT
jgi:hypothetical protein